MKKLILIILGLILFTVLFTGCVVTPRYTNPNFIFYDPYGNPVYSPAYKYRAYQYYQTPWRARTPYYNRRYRKYRTPHNHRKNHMKRYHNRKHNRKHNK